MKRRNFLKTTVASGAGIIVAPSLLLAKDKYVSMPKLLPGQLGVIYGLAGSGKSKVIYTLAERPAYKLGLHTGSLLIYLEVNPDLRVFKNLKTIIQDYAKGGDTIYIDNIDLVAYHSNDKHLHTFWDVQKIVMKELVILAREQKCKIWITKRGNKYWNDVKIHKIFTAYYPSFKPAAIYVASLIVYVYNENRCIYGDIVKNRYGDRGTIYFGKAKNLGRR